MFIQSWGVIFTRKDFFVKNVLLLSLASFSIRLALRLGLCFVEGMWVIKKGKQEYRLSFFSWSGWPRKTQMRRWQMQLAAVLMLSTLRTHSSTPLTTPEWRQIKMTSGRRCQMCGCNFNAHLFVIYFLVKESVNLFVYLLFVFLFLFSLSSHSWGDPFFVIGLPVCIWHDSGNNETGLPVCVWHDSGNNVTGLPVCVWHVRFW